MRWGQPWGTGHGVIGGFQGESCLAVICPGGHQERRAQDFGGDRPSLESHVVVTSSCPRYYRQGSFVV